MYKAIYDYFEKKLDCSYHCTDTDSLFITINVQSDSTIDTEMNKISDILHNSDLHKIKDELPNDTIIEVCFLTLKHIVIGCITTLLIVQLKKKKKSS